VNAQQSTLSYELVETHAHLDYPDFANDLDDVLRRAADAGVTRIITIGTSVESSRRAIDLAEKYPAVYAAIGVHPTYVEEAEEDVFTPLRELEKNPRVVAIGETGLDYYRVSGDLEWQRERFRAHIRAARECGKPLVIHTRQAAEDTLTIMREEGAGEVGGVMHCFTESQAVADAALALGFHISFSGIVTFKNAGALKDVARQVPPERLLVETDSPYLAPVPHRGKINRPGLVRHVAEEVARLRGISLSEVAAATTGNFFRLFKEGGA